MDFSKLITSADWTNALQELSNMAIHAMEIADTDELNRVRGVLNDFRNQLPNGFDHLDSIAVDVITEINRASRTVALKNLRDLVKQLDNLNKLLNSTTQHAIANTDSIQLKNVKDFLSKAKTSLTILTGLKADLADNTTDLGKKITAVFKAIKDFEDAFPDA